jgi:hypothetical protein
MAREKCAVDLVEIHEVRCDRDGTGSADECSFSNEIEIEDPEYVTVSFVNQRLIPSLVIEYRTSYNC